jgi:hypothetical protein
MPADPLSRRNIDAGPLFTFSVSRRVPESAPSFSFARAGRAESNSVSPTTLRQIAGQHDWPMWISDTDLP